jgi:predicted acylesterase/phospholipase RssA
MRIKNLVVSGGSIRSIAVIGCLQYVYNECGGAVALDSILNVVGTSAGAIVALMLVLGYRPPEMASAMKEMLVGNAYHKLAFDDLLDLRVFETYGMDSGQGVETLVVDLLKHKGFDASATFMDVAKRTGKNLVVCVANLSRQRSEYKCVDASPDLPVSTAIRMSVSLPILFAPVHHEGELYVDGALYESLPIGYIADKFKDSLRDTLAIRTAAAARNPTSEPKKIDNIASYFNAMISSLLAKANEAAIDKALRTSMSKISIFDVKPDVFGTAEGNLFGFDISNMNFAITNDSIDDAVKRGYAAFEAFVAA